MNSYSKNAVEWKQTGLYNCRHSDLSVTIPILDDPLPPWDPYRTSTYEQTYVSTISRELIVPLVKFFASVPYSINEYTDVVAVINLLIENKVREIKSKMERKCPDKGVGYHLMSDIEYYKKEEINAFVGSLRMGFGIVPDDRGKSPFVYNPQKPKPITSIWLDESEIVDNQGIEYR